MSKDLLAIFQFYNIKIYVTLACYFLWCNRPIRP